MSVMSHIKINQRQMGFAKASNCKFSAKQGLEEVTRGYVFSYDGLGRLLSERSGQGRYYTIREITHSHPFNPYDDGSRVNKDDSTFAATVKHILINRHVPTFKIYFQGNYYDFGK